MEADKSKIPSILLCLHGYTEADNKSTKQWREVIKDRLENTYRLAKLFYEFGIPTYLVFSGGIIRDGKVEADIIYEYTRAEKPEIFKIVTDVILERESKNTQENVDEILKWATKKNAIIIAVSSKDHASRVIKDWAYDSKRDGHIILISPSSDSYSKEGETSAPIVIEPPFWAYDILKDIFEIPEERREEIKKKLKEIIKP